MQLLGAPGLTIAGAAALCMFSAGCAIHTQQLQPHFWWCLAGRGHRLLQVLSCRMALCSVVCVSVCVCFVIVGMLAGCGMVDVPAA
jgi:hypothetical protein